MSLPSRLVFGLAVVLLAIAGFLWMGSFTPSFQECYAQRQQQEAADKAGDSEQVPHGPLASKLSIFFDCEGHFIDKNSTLITALATAFIGAFTLAIWMTASDQLRHARRVERAYVNMSHTPPGLNFHQHAEGILATIQVKVKNYGRTPADITDVVLAHHIGRTDTDLPPLPCQPPANQIPAAYFLVAGMNFFHTAPPFFISAGDLQDINNGQKVLWVYGYVEYRDRFGECHRGGYGRRYRAVEGNNLVFETAPGYNYDEDY